MKYSLAGTPANRLYERLEQSVEQAQAKKPHLVLVDTSQDRTEPPKSMDDILRAYGTAIHRVIHAECPDGILAIRIIDRILEEWRNI